MQLATIVQKELKLLFKDIHGLALLFLMPVVFILIMSLAMKQDFDRRSGVQLEVLVIDRAVNEQTLHMLSKVAENPLFSLLNIEQVFADAAVESRELLAEQAVRTDRYQFLISVPAEAFVDPDLIVADVLVAPGATPEMTGLFLATLNEAVAQQRILLMLDELKNYSPDLADIDLLAASGAQDAELISVRHGFQSSTSFDAPTSVQQNVPAWLVFSMFFVVVPLANTLINERQLGTLRRIRTIPVARWKLVAGKIIPYFFINQIQVMLMLIVGVALVPLFGGDRLTLGNSVPGLMLISASLSVAALGYAMLIAVICRSTEQATTLGGAGNIILAAIGGIMVPSFVMPEFMQAMTSLSPMAWGLQGFLDIFLRGGGIVDVWPEAFSLLALGSIALGLAILLLHRQTA